MDDQTSVYQEQYCAGFTLDTVGMESLKMAAPKQLQVIVEFDGRNFHLSSTWSSSSSGILAQEVST